MTADLLINGSDAYRMYGVRMGDGFLDALGTPAPMKEYVENSSPLEHGKRISVVEPKVDSREMTLEFTVKGKTREDYRAKKKAFFDCLYQGAITLCVPSDSEDVYKLVYRGNSPSYGQSLDRTFCRVAVKFEEPNPMDRTIESGDTAIS